MVAAGNMQIACGKCRFYFTTHDPSRPWGCSKFNFKSKNLPNQEVRQSTGMDCAYFTLKQSKNSTEGRSNGDQTIKIRLS